MTSSASALPAPRPFIKWVGGKTQLLPAIQEALSPFPDGALSNYVEPFVGGGAVAFSVLGGTKFDRAHLNDINVRLVNTYCVVRDDVEALIKHLAEMEAEYLSTEDKAAYYYAARDRYNSLSDDADAVELAQLFIFLNKTGFNGLHRVNRGGKFNVPFGKRLRPTICDTVTLTSASQALANVEVTVGDYRDTLGFVGRGTLLYLDPPYRPLSTTASFNSYAKDIFGDEQQRELARFVRDADMLGAKIIISNSDPKNTDASDDFFDDLYAGFNIQRVSARRAVNSDGAKRGKINELLITNF